MGPEDRAAVGVLVAGEEVIVERSNAGEVEEGATAAVDG